MVDVLNNYILELHYTTIPAGFSPMSHVFRCYVLITGEIYPGEDFDSTELQQRGGGTITLGDFSDDLIAGIIPFYPAATTFERWELWKKPVGGSIRTWIATKEIGENGTHLTGSRPAGQLVFTFRTLDGKYMKLYFMESSSAADGSTHPPYTGIYDTLASFIKDAASPIANKYHGAAVANMLYRDSENEELFKIRYP